MKQVAVVMPCGDGPAMAFNSAESQQERMGGRCRAVCLFKTPSVCGYGEQIWSLHEHEVLRIQ